MYSKKIKIGINGFGRIGKLVFKAAFFNKKIEVVAINDLMDINYIAYMIKYDSVHKNKFKEIKIEDNNLILNGKKIKILSKKNPSDINWKKLDIECVVESTGLFLTKEQASKHLCDGYGTKKVVISAPPKDDSIPMFVMGVNNKNYNNQKIVSTASCTTNCLAPLIKVIHDNFVLIEGLMTTIHASTATQKVVDGPSIRDWRAGRSSLVNIIPSSTGAAKAVGKIIPELNGKITGMAFRVPVVNVSVVDVTVRIKNKTNYSYIVKCIKKYSKNELKGILDYTNEEVVSTDFSGNKNTCIFDINASIMLNPYFFKLIAWYDNETAYSYKLVNFIEYMFK
ncbi:type I glyceraldehyde-3-phosphate dehydrogenase [Candidatus Shikimatogenerans silvanidophilus]|uniref:type I glyceraldehyde-3-phosphate dehydrogenase n=1 Tax=Candidatus Shikimatogenerans silvanidophilus TaxID=2782547 RepID=UPI001BAB50E2|nr:type I glyceraldehyde-3-phosphate dehydrogenase [Candidatus Shikimatogenerans silvanidophilus]